MDKLLLLLAPRECLIERCVRFSRLKFNNIFLSTSILDRLHATDGEEAAL